jgi:nucleotide-binding universal stress UspA family protein
MTPRILVPLDGSAESEAVLPEVERIAAKGADLHLVHVVPVPPQPTGMDPTAHLGLHRAALTYLSRVRRRYPNYRGQDLVRIGDPADEILAAALEGEVQWIAMCTHARSGLPRWILGSVAEQIVRRSQLPVLLTRPGIARPEHPLRRILVPLDTFPESATILQTVRPLAARTGAEVVLLHVRAIVPDPSPQWAMPEPSAVLETPEHRLQDMTDNLEEQGLYSWPVVVAGDPAKEILRQARDLEADLIAMTTHGRTHVEHVLVGSVAEAVLLKTARPVILQRPPVTLRHVGPVEDRLRA